MSESVDRRVRKTKKLLRQGLAKLLSEKPVNNITVRELSDLVDINRGTFYLHYRDIYDMVEQIQNEMFVEMNAIFEAHKENRLNRDPRPMLEDIFHYLAENADMARVLLSKNGDAAFVGNLRDVLREKMTKDWITSCEVKKPAYAEYFFSFVMSGCVGVFSSWLEGGMKEPPAEMAALVEKSILGNSRNGQI